MTKNKILLESVLWLITYYKKNHEEANADSVLTAYNDNNLENLLHYFSILIIGKRWERFNMLEKAKIVHYTNNVRMLLDYSKL